MNAVWQKLRDAILYIERNPDIVKSSTSFPYIALDELNDAMEAVFDGRQCPRMTAVDTGSDTYAVIFSSSHITDADAQKGVG
jgi:hypothetical protein